MASGCRWPKITAIWPRCWRRAGWGSAQPLVERAIALGQRYEARRAQLNGSADRPAIAAALTEKELALARLVAQRRTNKEIAETLHLSEGTVKQYINQLYAKLDIGGPCETSAPSWLPFLAQNTNQRLIGILQALW